MLHEDGFGLLCRGLGATSCVLDTARRRLGARCSRLGLRRGRLGAICRRQRLGRVLRTTHAERRCQHDCGCDSGNPGLSKAFKPTNKSLINNIRREYRSNPGIFSRLLNTLDTNTTAYSVAKFDPTIPLKSHKPVEATDKTPEYNVTNLSNGFTVLTESQVFPGAVHMGFLIDVGTRDETHETSGSCLALKNTYLKTLKHTNETINYGMI